MAGMSLSRVRNWDTLSSQAPTVLAAREDTGVPEVSVLWGSTQSFLCWKQELCCTSHQGGGDTSPGT